MLARSDDSFTLLVAFMIVPIQYVHVGIGILTAVLSIPLIYRKIPMNHAYGIRVRRAFVSNENWYSINEYGGKLFFVFGLVILSFSFLTWQFAPLPTSIWAPVYLVLPLLPIIPLIVLINLHAKGLPE
jgi:hypothetical protein